MKIVFSLSLLLLQLCPVTHGATCPTGQPKDKAALIQVEHRWIQAVEQHDPAALGCIVADEFEEADFDGSLISRSTMLAGATKPSNGHSELAELDVHIYGDVAYVRGIGVNSENGRPTGKTRFTDIFVYRDGRWQCVAGHDSRFPEVRKH
jgi:ketosteroid isomerase-like protein